MIMLIFKAYKYRTINMTILFIYWTTNMIMLIFQPQLPKNTIKPLRQTHYLRKNIERIKCVFYILVSFLFKHISWNRLSFVQSFAWLRYLDQSCKKFKNPNKIEDRILARYFVNLWIFSSRQKDKILARSKVLSTFKSFLPQDFTSYIGKPLNGDWLPKVRQGHKSQKPSCPHDKSWYF